MLKLDQLTKLHKDLREMYDVTPNGNDSIELPWKTAEDLIVVIQWAEDQLKQRKVNSRAYLKKQTIKNKLLREHLSSDELRSIDEQARKAAEESLEGEGEGDV